MASKKELNKYRHKWENRMIVVSIIVAILAIIAFVVFNARHDDPPTWLRLMVTGAFASPIMIAVFIHYSFWKEVVDSVEVTDKQYPELNKIFQEQVKKANLGFTPRLYVKNGNGVMNAFASKHTYKTSKGAYILLYSDMVDVFYDLGNADTIRYIMSHELGHIKLGHVNIRRSVMQGILRPVFLHDSFSRAQEYSADRFGASITKGIAMPSLAVLAAGKRNYERVNIPAYIKNDTNHISKFWVAIVNFRANHAVGRRRLAAAQRMDKEGWQDVHGKML